MAVAYQNLNVTKRGYVSIANPDTHYNVSPTSSYPIRYKPADQKTYMFFGVESFPHSLRRKKITEIQVTARIQQTEDSYEYPYLQICSSPADFDASTITWNTMPDVSKKKFIGALGSMGTSWQNVTVKSYDTGTDNLGSFIGMLHSHAFCVGNTGFSADTQNLIPAANASGSNQMIRVTYDPSVDVIGKVVMKTKPSYGQMPTQEAVFVWDHEVSGGRCADEYFAQASAVFKYKASTASEWTTVNISGDTKTYSIPANTLPTASTIEWELSSTDEDGTTSSTSGSFTTCTPTLTLTNYPSGSNFDTRNTTVIEWTLRYSGQDYPQESASFFWRKSTDSTWNEIPVSPGSANQLTIPANTFPTACTIQFYLASVDSGGHAAQTSVRSFTTVTTTIKASVYPDGNNTDPSQPILFEWYYNCVYEDYDQSQAQFQWRRSTDPDWNTITITGNIKSYQIPANTFSTGATIQWRVIGTDSGGHQTQTNALTFRTLTTQITPQDCPTSGYVDPRYQIVFKWYYSNPASGDYPQASAIFYWKTAEDADYTQIAITGNTKQVTFAAGQIPVATTISWYITGTDTGGTTTSTEVFEFSTAASTAFAYCVSPSGRMEDGTKPITFTWTLVNEDGTSPTRVILKWKYDTDASTDWQTIIDTTNPITTYEVPGNYFGAGIIEWKVCAYNRDDTAGPENQVSFVCMLAPDAPAGLSATAVPRTLISWQSRGQEAYEVIIDGVTVKKEFGKGVYNYQQQEPLADGEHVISVRIQGLYGMWSNYSTTSIFVENQPSVDIQLDGVFDLDAVLAWAYTQNVEDADAHVYRDGKRIADVGDELFYRDRLVLGEHSYYVELWAADGNYSRSNTVAGEMSTTSSHICLLSGGDWLQLKLSENSDREENYVWSRNYAMQYVLGSAYPVIEIGEHEDLSGTFDCAFADESGARAFEAMRGQVVILKARSGNVIVGAMIGYSKKVKDFYITYTFSLQQIHVEEP
ncbi:MAG TPA: hypothetical protein DEV97_06360 [Lachnospiraceae bacterium]|nr:hypothetical protein [Lachnospiraceae bacterium]